MDKENFDLGKFKLTEAQVKRINAAVHFVVKDCPKTLFIVHLLFMCSRKFGHPRLFKQYYIFKRDMNCVHARN